MKTKDIILTFILTFVLVMFAASLFLVCLERYKQPVRIEAENEALRSRCDSLMLIVNMRESQIEYRKSQIDSLERLISKNTVIINQNRKKYEEEIVRLDSLNNSELFRFFTDYLESN